MLLVAACSLFPAAASAEDSAAGSEALGRGVDALLAVLNQDGNDPGLIFPLYPQSKIIEYEEIEVRYRTEVTTVPVYKNVYAPVEVIVPVKTPDAGIVLRKTVRKKLVKRIRTGQRRVERLVRDEDGDIVRTHRRPVYGPGGPHVLKAGWLGDNALALYALLEAGVTPEQQPRMKALADALEAHMNAYGLPDHTWDIAWTATALTRYPGLGYYDQPIQALLSRLIAGQCGATGKKGLWGPLCVSAAHVRSVLGEFSRVEQVAQRLAAMERQPGAKNDPQVAKYRMDVQNAREAVFKLFGQVSRSSHYFSGATRPLVLEDKVDLDSPGITTVGWPFNFYWETMGDLQSTALAVFALRVAHEHRKLPELFAYEDMASLAGKRMVRLIEPEAILTQTMSTLAAGGAANGQWDEMVVWEPTREFAKLTEKLRGPPIRIPRTWESRKTPICSAQGVGAMEDLLTILGEPARQRYGAQVARARKRLGGGLDAVFAKPLPLRGADLKTLKPYRSMDPIAGGVVEPYDLFYSLRLDPATFEADDRRLKTYTRMIEYLVAAQGDDGLWDAFGEHCNLPTPAMRELARRRISQLVEEWKRKGRSGSRLEWEALVGHVFHKKWWASSREEIKLRATAYAVLALVQLTQGGSAQTPEAETQPSQ